MFYSRTPFILQLGLAAEMFYRRLKMKSLPLWLGVTGCGGEAGCLQENTAVVAVEVHKHPPSPPTGGGGGLCLGVFVGGCLCGWVSLWVGVFVGESLCGCYNTSLSRDSCLFVGFRSVSEHRLILRVTGL